MDTPLPPTMVSAPPHPAPGFRQDPSAYCPLVDSGPDTWLVVGLGNPGRRYSGNRHNVGAMVAFELASRHDVGSAAVSRLGRRRSADVSPFSRHRARAMVSELRLAPPGADASAERAVLAVPLT